MMTQAWISFDIIWTVRLIARKDEIINYFYLIDIFVFELFKPRQAKREAIRR